MASSSDVVEKSFAGVVKGSKKKTSIKRELAGQTDRSQRTEYAELFALGLGCSHYGHKGSNTVDTFRLREMRKIMSTGLIYPL